jgi:tetratricopeptide (TPR) repeat protein
MLAQNDAKRELSLSHQWIGIAHKARGEFAEASIAFENSMDIRKQFIEADSGNLQFKRDLVIIKYEVADNLLGLGRKAEAILAMQEAIAVGERLDRWNPNASVWEADRPLLKTMASLVGIDQGPPSDAITTNNDALSMLRAWTGKYSNDNVIGSRLLDLELRLVCKSILIEEERPTDALAICQGGIQVARALVGKEPENSEWQDKLFLFQVALSKVLQINEDFGGAFSAARKAHGITTELLERDPTNSRWQQNFAYVNDILGSLLGPI